MTLHRILYLAAVVLLVIGCFADGTDKDLWMSVLGWMSAAGAAIVLTKVVKDR